MMDMSAKRIMLFGMGDVCYDIISSFNSKLKEYLENKGIAVDLINVNGRTGYSRDIVECFEKNSYAAAISFNSAGEGVIKGKDGINLFDQYNVPYYLFLLDHPMDHYVKIVNGPDNMHVICIDRDHVDYVRKLRPDTEKIHFILPGGMETDGAKDVSEADFLKRPYELVFTGTRNDLSALGDDILSLEQPFKTIAAELAELMLSERQLTNDEALERILKDNGLEGLPGSDFAAMENVVNRANLYVRTYVREEIVRILMASDISFDIFGNGWDGLMSEAGENVRLHGSVSYSETLRLNGQAKLMLNIMPWFKNGSHDRIPTAMLNGAAVLTDHSRYLDECFLTEAGNDEKLFFYDIEHPERVGSIASEILADKERLYRTAGRGREYAEGHMTWEQTGDALLSCIFGM